MMTKIGKSTGAYAIKHVQKFDVDEGFIASSTKPFYPNAPERNVVWGRDLFIIRGGQPHKALLHRWYEMKVGDVAIEKRYGYDMPTRTMVIRCVTNRKRLIRFALSVNDRMTLWRH